MKTDFSKLLREEIEARITTMLLGEMSAEDARELMEFVANDAELMRLHDDLKATISLVEEATALDEPAQISEGKREALLRSFKVVPIGGEEKARPAVRSWLALAAMVAFLFIVTSAMFLPQLAKSKAKGQRVAVKLESDNGLDSDKSESLAAATDRAEGDLNSAGRAESRGISLKQTASIAPKLPTVSKGGESHYARMPQVKNALEGSGVDGTKIELPALAQADAPAEAKSQTWSMQVGQSRGFGEGSGADGFFTFGGEPQRPPQNQPRFSSVPGNDAGADRHERNLFGFAYTPPASPAAPTDDLRQKKDTAVVELFADVDVKKNGAIDTTGGLAAANGPSPAAGAASDATANGQMGAMGGGSMQSMQYYMSNPELMKRYFPQMYEKMKRGNDGAGSAGGLPGAPGLTDKEDALGRKTDAMRGAAPAPMMMPPMAGPQMFGGGMDRYRVMPPTRPVPHKGEGKIVAGKELKLAESQVEPAQLGREAEELAKKNEKLGVVVLGDQPTVGEKFRQESETIGLLEEPKAKLSAVDKSLDERDRRLAEQRVQLERSRENQRADVPIRKPVANAPVPQPEVSTAENAFSTFSLNVSDVSFKLAAASLEKGLMPDVATVRSEEFINAFDYRDPEPPGAPVGFVWERARYPFAQGRDLLRFSVKTAASGRQAGRPLNLVLLLDSSGSMERADRVRILQECLKTLAAQLRPEDRISVVTFARTARLWIDGLPGNQANELPARVGNLNPEGGTNLEEAMRVAYETARKHFSAEGVNRVVLLTDGAANLGDVEPESLKQKVEAERKKGVALDCFGIGWDGLNDELLETLSRNGDGRYGFVNTPEAAGSEFAAQLAGALQVAASDVKVQVEWNPKRVSAFRQIGYAKHQLTKEQFRDNTVDAAEIGAAEAGNALYVVQVNPAGEGPLGTVRVRYKVPGTNDYREHEWLLNYEGAPKPLENSTYALRLAGSASAFSEWLVASPYAAEVTTDRLLSILSGVPEHFAPDPRPKKLEWMIRQAKSVAGK